MLWQDGLAHEIAAAEARCNCKVEEAYTEGHPEQAKHKQVLQREVQPTEAGLLHVGQADVPDVSQQNPSY